LVSMEERRRNNNKHFLSCGFVHKFRKDSQHQRLTKAGCELNQCCMVLRLEK